MEYPNTLVNGLALPGEHRATYRRTGALLIKNLFTENGMALLTKALEEDVQNSDHPDKFTSAFDLYSNKFLSRSGRLREVIERLDTALAEFVEEKIVFTQGIVLQLRQGTPGFQWHFDEFSYCFVRPQDMGFTLWIPLIPINTTQQHGGLLWVNQDDFDAQSRMQQWAHYEVKTGQADEPESKYGVSKNTQYGDTWVGDLDQEMLTDLQQECDMELGDAFIFNRYTWHKSHPLGPGPLPNRTALVLRVVSADSRFDKTLFESVMRNRDKQDPPPSFGHQLARFKNGISMHEAAAAGASIWSPAPATKPAENRDLDPAPNTLASSTPNAPATPDTPNIVAREGDLQQQLVLAAAAQRGIQITDVSDTMDCKAAILESAGQVELLVQGIVAGSMNLKTKHFCDFKQLTKTLFELLRIPSPQSLLFSHIDDPRLENFIQAGRLYVCKPQVAANGIGVEMNITSFEQVKDYWERNQGKADPRFLLEEQIEGQDLRIQVIGGRIAASCIRVPAYVVGDGHSTLEQLVELRQKVVREQNPSDSLELDRSSYTLIKEQGLSLDSVPKEGRHVQLKTVVNVGQGGIAIDVTDEVHPGYTEWVNRIVEVCDASFFALDVICRDHTQAPENNAVALELNALAEWTHHNYSERGTRDLGQEVIDAAFGRWAPDEALANEMMKNEVPAISAEG